VQRQLDWRERVAGLGKRAYPNTGGKRTPDTRFGESPVFAGSTGRSNAAQVATISGPHCNASSNAEIGGHPNARSHSLYAPAHFNTTGHANTHCRHAGNVSRYAATSN